MRLQATFDHSLHNASDFDAITNVWVHVTMAVSPGSIVTYDDGAPVADSEYGFYAWNKKPNLAKPSPKHLSPPLGTVTLLTDLFRATHPPDLISSLRLIPGTGVFLGLAFHT